MGIRSSLARGSVRFSLGVYNTQEDVDYLLRELPPIIQRLRGSSPLETTETGKETRAQSVSV